MHIFSMSTYSRLITVKYFCIYEFAILLIDAVYKKLVFALKVSMLEVKVHMKK